MEWRGIEQPDRRLVPAAIHFEFRLLLAIINVQVHGHDQTAHLRLYRRQQ
jgi:hypothetical protein